MQPHRMTFQDVMQFYSTQSLIPQMAPENDEFIKAMINTGLGTDVWNAIYGAQAWFLLNTESNLFGLMPKLSWDKSGWRVITNFVQDASTMGIAETGTLSSPDVPTIDIVKLTPKIVQSPFEVTDIVEQLAKVSQDDLYANLNTLRQYFATMHIKNMNINIGTLAVGKDNTTSVSGSGLLNIESLDRIVSSYAEGTAIGLTGSTTPTLAEVVNPYNGAIDRSGGASTFDSYVAAAGSGTIGTLAALTDEDIRVALMSIREAGGRTNLAVTGYDTYATIQGIYSNQLRFLNWGELFVQQDINGVSTQTGLDAGIRLFGFYGTPIIQAVNTPSDSFNGGSSRIYLLDTTDAEGYGDTRLGFQTLKPTQYLETTDRDFILLNNIAYEGMYYTMGELACRFPSAQGKIRDIS